MLKSTCRIIVVIALIIIVTITTVTTLLTVHPSRKPTRSESQSASPSTAPSASMMPTFEFPLESVFSIKLAGTCISTAEIVEELLSIIENAVPSSLYDSAASFVITKTESSCDSWERRQLMNNVAIGTITYIIVAQIKLGGDVLMEAIKDDLLGKDLSSGVFVDSIGLIKPSDAPSLQPSLSMNPSTAPSDLPSISVSPTTYPSLFPSESHNPSTSLTPSQSPSIYPSGSQSPSTNPSESQSPSTIPTTQLSIFPSHIDTWKKLGDDIIGESANDNFGWSICLSKSGKVLAVGGPYDVEDHMMWTSINPGHVRVFKWSGKEWIQRGDDFGGDAAGDHLGWSVALSADGSVVIMGAPFNDDSFHWAGHVRVYEWSKEGTSEAWVQKGSTIVGEAASDESGFSVTMNEDGSIIGVGSPWKDDGSGSKSGQVRVFEFNDGSSSWVRKGLPIGGGYSISLDSSGSTIAIGAPWNFHVRVYDWDESIIRWVQRGADIESEQSEDVQLGVSVSLNYDGKIVAIGSPYYNRNARVYEWNTIGEQHTWIQRGASIMEEGAVELGSSISLNSSGDTLAVGARYAFDGDNNPDIVHNPGNVSIYKWDGLKWNLKEKIWGDTSVEWFGFSVSISADGLTFAAGAPFYDGDDGGAVVRDVGVARVYKWY